MALRWPTGSNNAVCRNFEIICPSIEIKSWLVDATINPFGHEFNLTETSHVANAGETQPHREVSDDE